MEYDKWRELQTRMAIEAIAEDLTEIYVPYKEALIQAKASLDARNNNALEVERKMGQAIHALEKLGYKITPNTELTDK